MKNSRSEIQQQAHGTLERNLCIYYFIKMQNERWGVKQFLATKYGITRERVRKIYENMQKQIGG